MYHIQEIKFLGSFPREQDCPPISKPEYAFIGRSNVGKSSLINMLLGRKEIARTSKKPGKTQAINLFEIEDKWIVADLPGYGYAKVSKAQRVKWENNLERYLMIRPNLVCTFVLIDIRHPLQPNDLEFLKWLAERHIAFGILFTKADKLKASKLEEHHKTIADEILEYWHALPFNEITSAQNGLGRNEVLGYISKLSDDFYLTLSSQKNG